MTGRAPWDPQTPHALEARPKTPELATQLRLPWIWRPARESGPYEMLVTREDGGESRVLREHLEVRPRTQL